MSRPVPPRIPVFLTQTLNESFDVSYIEIVSISFSWFFGIVSIDSDIDIRYPTTSNGIRYPTFHMRRRKSEHRISKDHTKHATMSSEKSIDFIAEVSSTFQDVYRMKL